MKALAISALAVLLAACAGKPPAPDWQVGARGALDRYQQAFLAGATRAADAEFARARQQLASTGQPTLVARAELTRCALQVASLAFERCDGFEALRADAAAPERSYADFLAAQAVAAGDALPPAYRPIAAGRADAATLAAIQDPLSRLIAAGVAVRAGRGSPELLQIAADTASGQGWRRPLLAWLGAQVRLAEQRGATDEAERLRRRIALASEAR